MGQSDALSVDLGIRGSKILKGISAIEAVRFARLLHRNNIFKYFKGRRKKQLGKLSCEVMHMENCRYSSV